jgi:hypothetical protein
MCKDMNQMKEYSMGFALLEGTCTCFLYPQGISNSNLCLQIILQYLDLPILFCRLTIGSWWTFYQLVYIENVQPQTCK